MSFLRNLWKRSTLDGAAMAQSAEKAEYAQIELLAAFRAPRSLHDTLTQQQWNRVLPRPYVESIALLQKQGWLAESNGQWQATATAMPFLDQYEARLAAEKAAVLPKVRKALAAKDTSEALALRRAYEAQQPLGKAAWTGPEPQLSHSALTRRILFLKHWLLDDLNPTTADWLKSYAAEQHLWGAYWSLPLAEIPANVQQALTKPGLTIPEVAYWRAYQLALYVDNQETWQRCKGGDHVRRLEIVGPNDEYTCDHCRQTLGKQFLVARAPELPHPACQSVRGCRCRYEPVLESYEDMAG
ncbi:MAG: hypothetical protein KF832_04785 [Caldilineaceae bacterium]|nr:hypothetical protein [Caldilineaceae bacterium]